MTILVVGDANADISAMLNQYPHEGADALVHQLVWSSGGSSTNVAIGLGRLDCSVRLLARVGKDPAAAIPLAKAQQANVQLDLIQQDPHKATGLCYVGISPSGERTLYSYRGANQDLAFTEEALAALDACDWVHIGGHSLIEGIQRQTVLALIDAAHERKLPISLDLCLPLIELWRESTLAILPKLHVVFANEEELLAMFASQDYQQAIGIARDCDTSIVAGKRGPDGAIIVTSSDYIEAKPFIVDAVDSNGCGDAFVAGFIAASIAGLPLPVVAQIANAMGAYNATQYGAAEALPNRQELERFLQQNALNLSEQWQLFFA
jgi:ribokinase